MPAQRDGHRGGDAAPGADMTQKAQKIKKTQPDKARDLARMKALATGLLVAAAALFVLARSQHEAGVWPWVAAFAEAATVGALADWFAVVALFRRPLGLPIPHTAILPANKARVADNLAVFIRDKFLGTDALLARVTAFDPAKQVSRWLADPVHAQALGERMARGVAESLDVIDDDRVKAVLYEALQRRATQFDVGKLTGRLLALLTADNQHQLLLNEGIRRLSAWLDQPEVQQIVADRIVQIAGSEYPKMLAALGFIGVSADELGLRLAQALVKGFDGWLHDIGDDPAHERRRAFDETVEAFIARLKDDPAFRARIDTAKRELLARPEVNEYVGGVWDQFVAWLRDDLEQPDSRLRGRIVDAALRFAQTLSREPQLRDSLNDHLQHAIRALAPELRDGIAAHIAQTVKRWDDATLVRDVEMSIGRDLQFIRFNGTIVGGLAGLAIHAAVVVAG
jgi:uncharacterized membrane-anchored protein YjiN (DUF445 family)